MYFLQSCTDCLNPSNDPKLLKCFHTCCKICVGQVEPTQRAITCPICQHITPLPRSGMGVLPAAFHTRHLHFIQERLKKIEESPKPVCEKCMKKRILATRYCRQCSKFICEACCKVHEDWDALKNHEILSIDEVKRRAKCLIPLEEPQPCEKHGEKLKLYCETCQELVCVHYTIQVHKDHTHCVIADTVESYKQKMLDSLEPVKKQLKDIDHARHTIQDLKDEVSQQKKEIETNIQSSFQQLHEMLEQHEARLIANSEKLFSQKLESLNSLEDEAVNSYHQGKSCVHVITESVRTGSQEEVMTTKNLFLMQVNEFSEMLKDKSREVPEQSLANTGFAFCQNLEKILGEEIGCIYQARVSLNRVVTLEKRAKFGLDICDDNNQPCSLPTSAIQTRLLCSSTNEETLHVVTELDRGRYEIACQPTTPGLHTLEVKVHGRPVRGSPFAVRVIRSLDTPVRMIEGLNGPRGVAVNSKGEVIVCEADAKCVSIFSSTGERIKVFEGKMTNDRPLGTVRGVAVDQSDKILVLDSDHCLVHVFSPEGKQLNSMGRLGISCQGMHLTSPNGICVHRSTGSQYIVDRLGHCVHILAQNKLGIGDVRSQQFGSQGSENGQFNSPCDIACDSAGDVYVSDTDNHRIQVFTPDGCYLRQFGKEGSGPGELNGPIGICIDSADIVYVGELHNQRISVLTTDGEWIKCFGCEGSGPGQFDGVFGMTVDHSGVLYVSDYGNKRVQVF